MEFLRFLAQYRTPAGDIFFQGITYLAQEVFVVAVICWLFWCTNKRLAYTLGFSYFSSGLFVQGLKITFRIPRPWILDPTFSPVNSAVAGATGYSFPSGHTQSISSLFGTLAFHGKKLRQKCLCLFVVFLVGFSRMYLGCHTPKDVCTSWALTLFFTWLAYSLFYKRDFQKGKEGRISLIMAALCIFLCIYAVILNQSGTITLSYARDCLKAAGAGTAFALGFYVENRFIRFTLPKKMSQKLFRTILGLTVALCIQEGLKPLIGTSLPASFIRYFLVVSWILILYPLLFTKFSRKDAAKA